jgi:hypothetical protein
MFGSAPARVVMSGARELVVLSLDRPSGRGSFFDAACPVLDAMARFQKALGMVEASYCDLFSFRDRSRDRTADCPDHAVDGGFDRATDAGLHDDDC